MCLFRRRVAMPARDFPTIALLALKLLPQRRMPQLSLTSSVEGPACAPGMPSTPPRNGGPFGEKGARDPFGKQGPMAIGEWTLGLFGTASFLFLNMFMAYFVSGPDISVRT